MRAADARRTAGQYTEAIRIYRAAQAAAATARQRAITDNNLAALYAETGERNQARRLYRAALATWERELPAKAPEIATTLNNLGALCQAERRYRDAAYYYERSRAIQETPNVLNNLAELYRAEGRYTEAERLYRRLIETLPADDLTRGTALNNLGELCRQKRRYAEAETYYLRALEVWQRTLGPEHPHRAATEANLLRLRKTLTAAAGLGEPRP